MLLPEEQRVLGLKYKSKRIKDLSTDDLVLNTKGLCFKTCVVTGWQMPEMQEYVNVFEDQLRKFLVDEYMNINIDEFEYAMRVFGTRINDWGRTLNLSLIRQALDSYIGQREELSKIEEQAAKPKEIEAPPPGPVDWSDTWDKLVAGEITGTYLKLVPWSALYDWLQSTGKVNYSNKERWGFVFEARTAEISRISIMKEGFTATPEDKANLERLKEKDWHTDERSTGLLISKSKEIAVKQLLNKI